MVIVIRPVVPRKGKDFFQDAGCVAIFKRSALRELVWTPESAPPGLPALHGAPQTSPSSSSATSAPPATSTSAPAPPPARHATLAPAVPSSTTSRTSPAPPPRTTGTSPRTIPVATDSPAGTSAPAAPSSPPAPAPENIGASFGCICYEWTEGRRVPGAIIIWVGHGAKEKGPGRFPGILRFRQLAGFCLTAASQHSTMQENMVRAAVPPPINRILFISCYALNWVTAHLPDFFEQIATPQNTDLLIDASNLKVHNGSIGEILRNLSDPRSLSVLARLKLTRTAELPAERFTIRLSVGGSYVFGPAMLEEVLTNYTALIQRGWRTADRIIYLNIPRNTLMQVPAGHSTRPVTTARQPAERRLPPLTGRAPR